MEIAVVGVSYKEATVQIRGEVAFTTSMKEEATHELLASGLEEFLIISTCNRSEIYIATKDMNCDLKIVEKYFVKMAGPMIVPYLFVKKYEVALQHIYQVAMGLDSLIVGEDEILGQMKRSLHCGIELGSCRKYMTKVVREAITFSKKVRHAYKLSENQLSVASIGIKYLKDIYGDLRDKKILLIGTGTMGQLILRYLESEKIKDVYLTNRTFNRDKVEYYVGKSIHVIDYTQRYDYIKHMDIIISATSSPHTIIKSARMGLLKKQTTFLDMAVPRDIDLDIDDMELAHVITLDTFSSISDKHRKLRLETAGQINRLILEEVKELELWILRTKVDGVILEFHKKQSKIIANSVKQLEKMNLSKENKALVKELLERSTWQMIKEPIQQLKALKEVEDIDHYKMVIENLFDFGSGDN